MLKPEDGEITKMKNVEEGDLIYHKERYHKVKEIDRDENDNGDPHGPLYTFTCTSGLETGPWPGVDTTSVIKTKS
jgi:hypothetical protein